MSSKPFLISAIVGNSRMLVTLTGDGEFQRVFWPNIDGGQHVERLLGGVSLGGTPVVWQDDPCWSHAQAYESDQNVLVTRSLLEGIHLTATDAALPGRDVLMRHLIFANTGADVVQPGYALYQWIRFDENPLYNTALYDGASDSLMHYRRDLYVAAGADRALSDISVGNPHAVLEGASSLQFAGAQVLHGDQAAAGYWDLGALAPGESVSLTVYLAFGHSAAEVRQLLADARSRGAGALLAEVRAYWTAWLAKARPLNVGQHTGPNVPLLPGIPLNAATPDQVLELYRRSLLVFKLMSDEQTGAVVAAPEFDPAYTSCGGYAYCWGRDAAYITVAMDLAGYHDLSGAFYRWAVGAQEPEGWWMHRHYGSGHWGPSWGLIQVDETGSILYGMALHARLHGGAAFAEAMWPSVAKAAHWLAGNIDPATGLTLPAVDLWEERTAELTYSGAAVHAGLKAAAELADALGRAEEGARWLVAAGALREAILRECVRDGCFLRGRHLQVTEAKYQAAVQEGLGARIRGGAKGHPIYEIDEDDVPDASLLGISSPFDLVPVDHPVMQKTADRLAGELWTAPGGGLRRYVGDHYRGGGNPWVLCTLWLGLYEVERGNAELARQILDWTVARRNAVGVLAEQVDPETGESVWVVPLTWSHAMYVLLALRLYGA